MSEHPAIEEAAPEGPPPSLPGSQAEAKASPKSKRVVRPKIDLDDEIRRANELAVVSRKMLAAARNTSRNNKKAKQRLIKKAGKLSPEDLERIAVLKRCGLFVDEADDEDKEGDEGDEAPANKKTIVKGPSAEEKKGRNWKKLFRPLQNPTPSWKKSGLPCSSQRRVVHRHHLQASTRCRRKRKGFFVCLRGRVFPVHLRPKKSSLIRRWSDRSVLSTGSAERAPIFAPCKILQGPGATLYR